MSPLVLCPFTSVVSAISPRTALLRRFVGYRRRLAIIRLGLLSAREDQLEDHIYEPQHKLQRHQEKQVIHDTLPVRIDFPQQRQG